MYLWSKDPFIEKESEPQQGLLKEEIKWGIDGRNNSYDHSFELGKQELYRHYRQSFKDTNSILNKNRSFFDNLFHVTEVLVLGHSLSEVDEPYFEEIKKRVNPDCLWSVSAYGESEKISHKNTLINLGIEEKKITIRNIESFK
ncbi:hypothetical protein D5018_19725 [Parashewanella curva]|uniref:DUF4917 family protein n=1 Tax=Parashewanella curva TaxID=2338552 RepID=A0A3L8PRG8_9GAMM|nr:AbiH family protein [Parashewanella curva]RLV57976.1 hypothetical protein D5018_19725 [Parashewanella curva]